MISGIYLMTISDDKKRQFTINLPMHVVMEGPQMLVENATTAFKFFTKLNQFSQIRLQPHRHVFIAQIIIYEDLKLQSHCPALLSLCSVGCSIFLNH